MNLVIDTHALFWLLTNDKRLSIRAKDEARKSSQLIIPTIVSLELLYLLQKKGLANTFPAVLEKLKQEKNYTIVSLDLVILQAIPHVSNKLEMHDRIIVATAQLLKVPIVTKDRLIQKVYKSTIW